MGKNIKLKPALHFFYSKSSVVCQFNSVAAIPLAVIICSVRSCKTQITPPPPRPPPRIPHTYQPSYINHCVARRRNFFVHDVIGITGHLTIHRLWHRSCAADVHHSSWHHPCNAQGLAGERVPDLLVYLLPDRVSGARSMTTACVMASMEVPPPPPPEPNGMLSQPCKAG